MIASLFILIVSIGTMVWLEYAGNSSGGLAGSVASRLLQVGVFAFNFLYFVIIFFIYGRVFDGIVVIGLCLFGIGFIIYQKIENDKIKRYEKEWIKRRDLMKRK